MSIMSFRETSRNRNRLFTPRGTTNTTAASGGGGMANIRRNTVQLARDVILRRLSRTPDRRSSSIRQSIVSTLKNRTVTVEEFTQLVHEINHLIASYRQLVQLIGTQGDSLDNREELSQSRIQCLKTCDAAKNCILPQLKGETQDPHQTTEFTKQANQFIGCVNMFVIEMKRCHGLLQRFPIVSARRNSADETDASTSHLQTNSDFHIDQELELLSKDLNEAEKVLDTLENAITVHFSTRREQLDLEKAILTPRSRKKGCQFSKLCSNFKTSYA